MVNIESRFDFKEEDGSLTVRFDNIGNNEVRVDNRGTESLGKRVLWLDEKMRIGEGHFGGICIKHPVVPVFQGGVVRDASELVKYTVRQHVDHCETFMLLSEGQIVIKPC